MKFKTKEELINEKYGLQIQNNNWEQAEVIEAESFKDGLDIAFKNFAERVEFYQKYRYERVLFKETHPKDYKEFEESRWSFFDLWLFDYCFGDVIE